MIREREMSQQKMLYEKSPNFFLGNLNIYFSFPWLYEYFHFLFWIDCFFIVLKLNKILNSFSSELFRKFQAEAISFDQAKISFDGMIKNPCFQQN